MARPKKVAQDVVVEAAKQTFWETGFDRTAISDLARGTGLYRSSLYNAFGTKRGLYAAAMESYVSDFVDPRLRAMERSPALSAVNDYFAGLAVFFRADVDAARRGCFIVNALGELAQGRDDSARTAAQFPERLRRAFARCLRRAAAAGQIPSAAIERRAGMLSTATLGIWLIARIDPRTAADRCDGVNQELASWLHH